MKRVLTATCVAAMFAVGLAAQSTGTAGTASQDPQASGGQGRGGGPRTVTGCLRAGDTAGTYTLTDIVMQPPGGGAATTTAGSTAAGGTTAGTGTAATAGGGQPAGGAPMSAVLVPDPSIDLKPHVGHKIEVTGSLVGGGRRGGGDPAATGTGTATGSTTTGGAGTATATGTGTGSTSGTGTSGAAPATGQGRGMRQMTVTAVRMVSESCS